MEKKYIEFPVADLNKHLNAFEQHEIGTTVNKFLQLESLAPQCKYTHGEKLKHDIWINVVGKKYVHLRVVVYGKQVDLGPLMVASGKVVRLHIEVNDDYRIYQNKSDWESDQRNSELRSETVKNYKLN